MGAYVLLSGWKPGLQKVFLSIMLRERTGMSIRDAHECVRRLIDGEVVRIGVPSIDDATALVDEVTALGVRSAISQACREGQKRRPA